MSLEAPESTDSLTREKGQQTLTLIVGQRRANVAGEQGILGSFVLGVLLNWGYCVRVVLWCIHRHPHSNLRWGVSQGETPA